MNTSIILLYTKVFATVFHYKMFFPVSSRHQSKSQVGCSAHQQVIQYWPWIPIDIQSCGEACNTHQNSRTIVQPISIFFWGSTP